MGIDYPQEGYSHSLENGAFPQKVIVLRYENEAAVRGAEQKRRVIELRRSILLGG